MTTRICTNKECEHEGNPQPIDQFNKDKTSAIGLCYWCKSCIKIKRANLLLSRTDEDKARLKKIRAAKLEEKKRKKEIRRLVWESAWLHKIGPIKHKKAIAENAVMIFKLGLIK